MNGRLPEISTSEPNSPTARAKLSATPETIAGASDGQHDPPKHGQRPGAERGGGFLHRAVELEQHRLHRAHDERQRHEQQRQHDRRARERDVDAERAALAVERQQHQPATIVGSANGRSMSALTIRLPGNSSRTSTHAISVPKIALISTTIAEVDERELDRGERLGACDLRQNAAVPPFADCASSAATGSSTSTDR